MIKDFYGRVDVLCCEDHRVLVSTKVIGEKEGRMNSYGEQQLQWDICEYK